MYQLSLNDIDQIRSEICRQRVSYSHLLDDLLDHVCCDVEEQMKSGLTFQEAYLRVKLKVGLNRYNSIQEETLFLIDKNYRFMKQFMKVFGVLSPTLISMAALFKIEHWPGAGIMLVMGFFFLCLFFLPSSVYVLYTENKGNKKHLLVHLSGLFSSVIFLAGILFKVQHWPGAGILLAAGLILIALVFVPSLVAARISEDKGKKTVFLLGLFSALLYITGFLFKIMHWPGASIVILIGLILFAAVFFPTFTYSYFKDSNRVQGRFLFTAVASMMAVLFISMMSLTVSKNNFADFIISANNTETVLRDLSLNNSELIKSVDHGGANYAALTEIQEEAADLEFWISGLKKNLVLAADPANSAALTENEINYEDIIGIDSWNAHVGMLFNNGKATELRKKLEGYKELLKSYSSDPVFISTINTLLNTSNGNSNLDNLNHPWELVYFEHRSLLSVLNSLTMIQVEVRLAEKEAFDLMLKNQRFNSVTTVAEVKSN